MVLPAHEPVPAPVDRTPAKDGAEGGEPPAKRKKSTAVSKQPKASGSSTGGEYELCHVLAHPIGKKEVRDYLFPNNCTRVLSLTLPATVWPRQPRTFFEMVCNEDTATQYKQILMVFGFLVIQAHAPRKVTDDDGVMRIKPSINHVAVTLERVPHANDPFEIVAYNLVLTERCNGERNTGMSGDLAFLLRHTDMSLAARQRNMGPTSRPATKLARYSYARVGQVQWENLCAFYRPRDLDVLKQTLQGVEVQYPDCALCPENVFSREYGFQLLRNLHADPRYYDPGYLERCEVVDPKNVWLLSYTDLDPTELEHRIMPTIQIDARMHRLEIAQYEKMHGPGSAAAYLAHCVRTIGNCMGNDITSLGVRVRQEKAELRAQHKDTPEYFRLELQKKYEWIQSFGEVFSKNGDCSDSIKAIAAWRDNYLAENGYNMRLPREQRTVNLSSFEDFIAQLTAVMESVVTVKSEHKNCLVYLLSALGVYMRVDMNLHTMLLGPAAVGKSFAIMLINKSLIDGTVRGLSYITAKAFAASGKQNDSLIILLEDAPATLFGVNPANRTKQAVSDDLQNMLKQLMTSQTISVQTLAIKDGVRTTEYHVAYCSIVFFSALNEPTSVIPQPLLSRHNVVVNFEDAEPASANGATLQTRQTRAGDEHVKEAFGDVRLWWCRTQVLMSMAMYMSSAGILPVVNLDAADYVFAIVTTHARTRYHLRMDDTRKWDRARHLCRVLVYLKAILLVWDSPLCPFKDQPHSDLHFLHLAKHLVCTKQIAFFVLGLLLNQWQDDLRARIVNGLCTMALPGAQSKVDRVYTEPIEIIEDEETQQHPAPPQPGGPSLAPIFHKGGGRKGGGGNEAGADGVGYDAQDFAMRNWMFLSCDFGTATLPAPKVNGGRLPSNRDLAEHLTNQLMTKLNPRPLPTEVTSQLLNLMEHMEDNTCKGYAKGSHPSQAIENRVRRPALVLDPHRMMLNVATIKHARETDIIFLVAQDVASALATASFRHNPSAFQATKMLYGDTEPVTRYVWRMLDVTVRDDLRHLCTAVDPHYFEEPVRDLTMSFLESIHPDDQGAKRRKQLFPSDVPMAVLDVDLDDYAALKHANDLGLSAEDQHAHPSNVEREWRKALYDIASTKHKLHVYPDAFKGRQTDVWNSRWKAELNAHPERFSMRKRMKEAQALQASRPSLGPLLPRTPPLALASPVSCDSSRSTSPQESPPPPPLVLPTRPSRPWDDTERHRAEHTRDQHNQFDLVVSVPDLVY